MNLSLLRKTQSLILGLLLLFVAAACTPAGSEVVPTPTTPSVPTTEPTIEPTDEPALEPAPTDGIHWSLIHTIVGGDAIVPIPADVIAYLQTEGELVSGKSGCNTFSGTAIVEGNRLSFGPLATTRMACPEEQTAFETEFLNLLSKVAIYKLTDGNLELQNNDGLPLALFAPATEQTLFVGPEQVDCTGVAPQKCLLVKEEPDAENTFFYNSIVGFNWEAGYEYELRVNVVSIPNPLADASSLRYELVEVIDRSAVEAPDTTNLVGTVWQWIRFDDFGEINSFEVADPTNYTIKFLTDGSYQLQNDCNSGGGSYEVDSLSLNILPGVSTLAACGEESLDQEFSSKLTQVASYVIEDGQLFLNLTVDSGNLVFSPAE